jgi:peptidoglycan/LPS O-acetylase OafA/YrhL
MFQLQDLKNKHIHSVSMLRGIASFGVCFAHLTGTVNSEILKSIGHFGTWGVSVFFIISGFIIPYSLYNSDYKLSDYPKFLLKRILRLDPPYLLTIVGIFALSWLAQLSPHHTSEALNPISKNTLYHLFYLVEILNGKWLIVVFWTLAIEFQFYLLIGLLFPLLKTKKIFIITLLVCILCTIPFLVTDDQFVTNYLLMFLSGIVYFLLRVKKINFVAYLTMAVAILILSYFKIGVEGIICPIISICFIQFVHKPFKPLIFLGMISYSLYLIHTPFGTDGLINFLQNYIVSDSGRIWLMFGALPVIIFCAWVFYLIIEKPSLNMAKKIRYNLN